MKKIFLGISIILVACSSFAQENGKEGEESKGKFDINRMYVGGGLNVGAGSGSFAFGIQPETGYSIARWLDAGISINLNYQTQKIIDAYTGATYAKYRAFNYGGGPFVRIWPVDFLHIAIQPEYNWIKATTIDVYSNQKTTTTLKAESLLVGVGYGGREIGKQLSYLTIMIDLAHNINSPYRDQYNHAQPVFRGGVGFYLGRRK